MDNQSIKQAKQALRRDSYANFAAQAPHLRLWLENLPILPIETLVQQKRAVERANQGSLDEMMAMIEPKWRGYHPPNSHEGATSAAFDERNDLLAVSFHASVWGMTSEQGRLTVARIGTDAFLFWPY